MNFRLESWEVPPDAQISDVQASNSLIAWRGRPTPMALRVLRFDAKTEWIVFRPQDESATNYLACLRRVGMPTRPGHIRRALDVLPFALRWDFWPGRYFVLHRRYCFVNQDECGWLGDDGNELARFDWPFEFFDTPAPVIFAWLQAQWQQSDSPVRQAFEWSQWNEATRARRLPNWVLVWGEIQALMKAVACYDQQLTADTTWTLGDANTPSIVEKTARYPSFYHVELATRLQRWSELFNRHFFPLALNDDTPLFVRDVVAQHATTLRVKGEDSSAHQKLEGALYLRAWLARNAPEQLSLIRL